MNEVKQATRSELEAGLEHIRRSPQDGGVLEMIVRRPQANEREMLNEATLDVAEGLIGDSWKARGSTRTPDGSANPEMQLTLMNSRVIALLAAGRERWGLAGDQLFVDLDLSTENLPPGTRLSIGSAMIETTSPPHTGCKKFLARYGQDALNFVNSPLGNRLHLRGINARIIATGVIKVGDIARKV